MIHLKDIDLSEVEKKKQVIESIEQKLKKEQDELRDMLVALNLDYYGMAPSQFYKSISKKYITDDEYSVCIKNGTISISKRLKEDLLMTWSDIFNADTMINISRSSFRYDSGRYVKSLIAQTNLAEKYTTVITRMAEILEEERICDPFTEYRKFYSFIDFFDLKTD